MQYWIFVITIVQMVAVPLIAFLIRMVTGDTRTDDEVIISRTLRAFVDRHLKIKMEMTS